VGMAVHSVGATPRVRVAPWNNPVIRGWIIQITVVGLVGALFCFLVYNTVDNLQRQKIATGFHYLGQAAGFEIAESMIPYSPSDSYGRAILVGLLNTLHVSLISIVFATVIGALVGVGRLSHNWLLAKISEWYVEIFRNVPLLLWLFFFYKLITEALPGPRQAIRLLWDSIFLSNRGLFLPMLADDPVHAWMLLGLLVGVAVAWLVRRWARARQMATGKNFPVIRAGIALALGVPLSIWLLGGAPLQISWPSLVGFNFAGGMYIEPEFAALLAGLVLYFSAFIAEIVRSGVLAVPRSQADGALALGLTRRQALWLVQLPQAMRVIIPPMTNQYLRITRSSSLAIAIGYPDLVAVVNVTINQTGQATENVLIMVAVYLTVSLSISLFMNWYNKRLALTER
jgi:general L-amino acid transport system permease protein